MGFAHIRKLGIGIGLIWLGWGVVEAINPIFISSFSPSNLVSGLLRSITPVMFLMLAPYSGVLIDKKGPLRVIIASTWVYPIIGLSYFLAGFLQNYVFLIIGRILNGANYIFNETGFKSYILKIQIEKKSQGRSALFTLSPTPSGLPGF